MLLDTQTLCDPFPLFRELRERSPVLWSQELDFWLLFRYDDVKRALEDARTFSSDNPLRMPRGGAAEPAMIFQDNPDHARLRRFVQPAFLPRRIASLEGRIRELCDELLSGLADGAFDLVRAFSGPLPALVIAELLGVPRADIDAFREMASEFTYITAPGQAERGRRGMERLSAYYAGVVAEKRRQGATGDDITCALLCAQAEGAELTDREIIAMGRLLLFAGHETTTNLINNTVRCLSETPGASEFLLADLSRAPTVIEEVLRCRGPALSTARIARHDVEVQRVTIPAGSRVLALIGSANRDGRAFDDPDRFVPDRAPRNHLSFGRGIHRCLGETLARLEARVAITSLYARFPGLRVDPERPAAPTRSFLIHGCLALPVRT